MISLSDIAGWKTQQDVCEALESRFGGDALAFLAELDAGLNNLLFSDLKLAGKYLSHVRRVREVVPPRLRPRVTAMEARYNRWRGKFGLSGRQFLWAQQQFRRQRNYLDAAKTGIGLMDSYMYLGKYTEALKAGKASLRYFKGKNLDFDSARVMTNIGNVYHRMDNNRMALKYYDQARDIMTVKGGVPLAIVEFNRANILANLNQLKEAEELYRKSASIYQQAGNSLAETQAHYAVAYLYFLQNRFSDALREFERVYTLFTELGDDRSAALTQLDLLELNIELNQYGSAIALGEELITRFRRLCMRYEEAKVYFFVAEANRRLDNKVRANRLIRRAERLFTVEKNHLWLGMVYLFRTKMLLQTRSYSDALVAARKASKLFGRSGDELRQANADIALVESELGAGNISGGRRRSKRMLAKDIISSQQYNLHCILGAHHVDRSEYEQALQHYLNAVKITESRLQYLYPDEIRFFFVMDKFDCYMQAVECQLKLHKVPNAFLIGLKALEMLNYRASGISTAEEHVPTSLIAIRERLRAALQKLGHVPRPRDQRTIEALSANHRLEQRLLAVDRRIRAQQYVDQSVQQVKRTGGIDLRHLVREDETLVSYVAIGRRIGAFWHSQSGTGYIDLGDAANTLELLVRKLHFICESTLAVSSKDDETDQACEFILQQLHELIITPVLPAISTNGVVFIADGLFAQIPYAALSDAVGLRLKDRFLLNMVVNPHDLGIRERVTRPLTSCHNAAFAVSSGSIPNVMIEAKRIASIFKNVSLYTEKEADTGALKAELQRADGFLHIAAHASRSSENPLFSRILMGDGPFFPFDLFGTGIQARLVTLSGCQTAAPGLYYGNSFSLAKAFHQAGARYTLASLWPVSDKLGAAFMIEFYTSLRETEDISASHRKAVDRVQELSVSPAFWGTFILLGV